MDKQKSERTKSASSVVEKAREKALKESYHFKGSQTGKIARNQDGDENKKSNPIKITIKK